MGDYAYYNGTIAKYNNIKIPLSDRLIYFGDGVYDVMIGHDSKVFLENEHLERLFNSANLLNIHIPFSKSKIHSVFEKLISLCEYKQYVIYISVSRNAKERSHSYMTADGVNLLITIKSFEQSNKNQIDLITEDDNRYYLCNIKTTNLLPAVLASSKAERLRCDETIFIRNGIVTECAHSNIFIIKDNFLLTHPLSNLILPGITRGLIINLARKQNIIQVKEQPFSKEDLFNADEIIISSTTKFIKRAASIDGISVGGRCEYITRMLEDAVRDLYMTT